ncbi:DNA polymerase beta domain protein region [Arcobacter nitrofigilis DSM 7299]|jgi:predicted nucleotidyltransferase|uniref:DNA polymerase beta domain protein region n=1 Tax=Arcobacter nitrofigilis (strain ATCC 33309 / DSM 7299 / CCUG 15893 / LMG 7604 / NCTC 12251 / CI) TaxID=572480 RepID=D5V4J0_ARCNC|nr:MULTISPECIES: nucleotidyltransferase domain-containing protein [Arcobacteraceae]ADG92895.1 DNA polymerase beta domain protein region [Arcobacter nitrofigilis DSM 7299]
MERKLAINILETFKNKNKDKYGIEAIGLFGSVARNEAKDSSDVDICIKTSKADMFTMVHIKEELEELMSSHIDIVRVREKMNPFLKNRIEKEAIYV